MAFSAGKQGLGLTSGIDLVAPAGRGSNAEPEDAYVKLAPGGRRQPGYGSFDSIFRNT